MQPIVTTCGVKVFATSRDVAAFFVKRHDNVLRAIDDLVDTEPSISLNFEEVTLPTHAKTGPRFMRGVDMDQEGFTLLAMG
ncbi:Rha family transcriptional regulator, partial [Stenotrophomonas maltophilia]|uniref:Rha family transcriptional regulator n=2 Tax=Stenotrophomonas maltophilia TaxID=40324 RepID=UPI0013DB7B2C